MSSPLCRSRSAVTLPMYPAPPVMRIANRSPHQCLKLEFSMITQHLKHPTTPHLAGRSRVMKTLNKRSLFYDGQGRREFREWRPTKAAEIQLSRRLCSYWLAPTRAASVVGGSG